MKDLSRSAVPIVVQQWLYWLTIAGIALFYVFTLRAGHDWGGDFSQYIYHSINLVEGKPYGDIFYIVNPYASVGPATYPPVLPLILAPVYAIWGLDLFAMKLVVTVFFVASLALMKGLFQHRISFLCLLALVLIIGFNLNYWKFADKILSDFPYLFFSLCSLYLMRLHSVERKTGISVLLGIFMYLAYGSREIGVILPLALVTFEIWHYRKLTPGSLIALMVFALLACIQWLFLQFQPVNLGVELQINAFKAGPAPTNLDLVQLKPKQISGHLKGYWEACYRFWRVNTYSFETPLVWLLNGFALTGFISSLKQKIRVTEIYFAGYVCAILLYGGFDPFRYLLPILPFYVVYIFVGISQLKRIHPYLGNVVFLFLTSLIFYSYSAFYFDHDYDTPPRGITSQSAEELFAFVRTQTQPTDVLVTRKPRVFGLFTQRMASAYPHMNKPDKIMRYLLAIDARYLIASSRTQYKVDSLLDEYPENFSLMLKNEEFNVYLLKPQ